MTDELWHGSYSLALEAICWRDGSIHGNVLLKVFTAERRKRQVREGGLNYTNYTNYSGSHVSR